MQIAKCKTIDVDISLIKPYWRNPRNISEKAVKVVAQSIKEYGFNQPIVIDKNNVIIVGHTRYKALLQLGYQKVSCVIADISENKAKEYRIADNKSNEFAEWDMSKLIPELFETDKETMDQYFNIEELDKLLSESSGSGENYESPTQQNLDTKQIDLNTNFKNKNEKEMSEYINLSCPECNANFNVKRNDILTRSD